MSGSIVVFIEDGKNGRKGDDGVFLEKYILEMFGKTVVPVPVGGHTNLHLVKNQFQINTDKGGTNLVLFDADTPEQDGATGEYRARKAYLESKRTELGIAFDLFLFPNDQDDGQFETMLQNVINTDNTWILSCFDAYAECLKRGGANLPSVKDTIYAYCDALWASGQQKEQFKKKQGGHYADPRFFDLRHAYLNPLKQFLDTYFA